MSWALLIPFRQGSNRTFMELKYTNRSLAVLGIPF